MEVVEEDSSTIKDRAHVKCPKACDHQIMIGGGDG